MALSSLWPRYHGFTLHGFTLHGFTLHGFMFTVGVSQWRGAHSVWPYFVNILEHSECSGGSPGALYLNNIISIYCKVTIFLRPIPGTFWMCKFCAPNIYCRGGSVERTAIHSPLSLPSHAASVHGTFSAAGPPLCRFPDMIVNSARAFIPISDLSITVKTWDVWSP